MVCYYIDLLQDFISFTNNLTMKDFASFDCNSGGVGGRSNTVGGFYLTEAFQSQTNTEKILYNKSR